MFEGNIKYATTECLINGKKVYYDVCSEGTKLEDAKKFYHAFNYIGSGYVYYINGTENVSKKLHHFFKRK